MITLERPAYYDSKRYNEYCGLSTDEKTTISAYNGDEFYEINTGKYYKYNQVSNEWVEQPTSGGGGGGVTTLHINITAVNRETMEVTFTADKTPAEMKQASLNGPIWCVVTFAAGIMSGEALSLGIPPAWGSINEVAFGSQTFPVHNQDGENNVALAVSGTPSDGWFIDLTAFVGD